MFLNPSRDETAITW